jgi:hypothetical protein
VGVANRDAWSLSFNEGDIESSEKLSILLSCWLNCRDAPISGEQSSPDCQTYLNYAEDERRKRRAGILRYFEPEGPHNTTECIKRSNSITQDRDSR